MNPTHLVNKSTVVSKIKLLNNNILELLVFYQQNLNTKEKCWNQTQYSADTE